MPAAPPPTPQVGARAKAKRTPIVGAIRRWRCRSKPSCPDRQLRRRSCRWPEQARSAALDQSHTRLDLFILEQLIQPHPLTTHKGPAGAGLSWEEVPLSWSIGLIHESRQRRNCTASLTALATDLRRLAG